MSRGGDFDEGCVFIQIEIFLLSFLSRFSVCYNKDVCVRICVLIHTDIDLFYEIERLMLIDAFVCVALLRKSFTLLQYSVQLVLLYMFGVCKF